MHCIVKQFSFVVKHNSALEQLHFYLFFVTNEIRKNFLSKQVKMHLCVYVMNMNLYNVKYIVKNAVKCMKKS